MISIKEGTRFYQGFKYIESAIGRTRYKFWRTASVPAFTPAWAKNGARPQYSRLFKAASFTPPCRT